jgi:hypothetical protein
MYLISVECASAYIVLTIAFVGKAVSTTGTSSGSLRTLTKIAN